VSLRLLKGLLSRKSTIREGELDGVPTKLLELLERRSEVPRRSRSPFRGLRPISGVSLGNIIGPAFLPVLLLGMGVGDIGDLRLR
jgi:hypothetical protein